MNPIAVIIPALNEAQTIGNLVAETRPGVAWVVVADNGSTDGTADAARAAGADVVAEPRRGYGYACAAGAARALALGAATLVFMDGDGSARPEELPRLLAPLAAGTAGLVLGSRVRGGAERGGRANRKTLRHPEKRPSSPRGIYHVEDTITPFRLVCRHRGGG